MANRPARRQAWRRLQLEKLSARLLFAADMAPPANDVLLAAPSTTSSEDGYSISAADADGAHP